MGATLRGNADQRRGEAHPYLSPTDEFAGYELSDVGNLNLSEAKKPEMLQREYARTALRQSRPHTDRQGLDRATGARQEKVYDVVWSDGRVPGADGKLHDLRPAYLSITERAPAIYSVLWKAPAMGERRLAVYPRLPLSPSLSS